MKYLRVWLDWCSTGIWAIDTPFQQAAGANVSYESLNLPSWLIDRFNLWTDWYNEWEPWNSNLNEPEEELFEAYGLSLAIDLKRFLESEYYIEYNEMEIEIDPFPNSNNRQ